MKQSFLPLGFSFSLRNPLFIASVMLPFAAWRGEVEAAEEYRDRLIPKTDSNPVVKVAQGDGAKEGGEAARSELAPMTVTGAADAPFTK